MTKTRLIFGIVAAFVATLAAFVHKICPYPLIDEIFHIPATQRYCQGNFAYWDPKITTPPGPYLLATGILKVLNFFKPTECNAKNIRMTNAFLFPILFYVLTQFCAHLYGRSKSNWMRALAVASFPLTVTFSVLFYTDMTSLLILLLFTSSLFRGNIVLASLFAMLSLSFRQTNIVWLFFTSCISFLFSNLPTGQAVRAIDREILAIEFKPWRKYFWEEICSVGIHLLYRLVLDISSLKYIFAYTFPLISSLGAFLIFLQVNGSIVLGDKDAHTAVFNPAQLLYFSLFTCIFALPCFVANLFDVLKFFYQNIFKFLVLTVISYLIIANYDIVHPYNLADNRHACFYAWRYLHKYRTVLQPVYAASILGVSYLLPRSFLWSFAFWICTGATVVPQKLFEFRYFMVPFTMVLIFSQKLSYKLQIIWNLLLLAAWLFIFKTKELHWESEADIQRIIW